MAQQLLTLITVVLNNVEEIETTITSVLNQQRFSDIEYIVIDGGSSDGTYEIIQRYNSQINLILSEKDEGLYFALNKGINLSNGKVIGFVHAGDKLTPGSIREILSCCEKMQFDVLYGDIFIKSSTGLEKIQLYKPTLDKLYKRMSIFHPSTYITKDAYIKYGLYDTKYRIAADYDYLLKLYKRGAIFAYTSFPFITFTGGGMSSRQDLVLKELKQIWFNNLSVAQATKNYLARYVITESIHLKKRFFK